MTQLVENTSKFNSLLELFDLSPDGIKNVIIKIDRGKAMSDAGDCYIVKKDKMTTDQD